MDRPSFLTLFLIVLLLIVPALRPSFITGQGVEVSSSRSADYGIFQRISDLNSEEATRSDDPGVVSRVQTILSSRSPVGHAFDEGGPGEFRESVLDIPSPITKSPVIFDALKENPVINNTRITDWIFPPLGPGDQGTLNYLLFVRCGSESTWKLGSITPKIGILVDSSLDKWVYADCDHDRSTGDASGNDIRVRVTFARDLLERDWEASLFPLPPSLKINNAGIRLEVEGLETTAGASAIGGKLYVIKGISYQGKNYLWSIGVDLARFMDRLVLRVQARQWVFSPSADLIGQLFRPGGINLMDLNLLEVLGPFTVSYEFDTAPEGMKVLVSVMRLEDRDLKDMAYIELGLFHDAFHENLLPKGALALKIKNLGSPIDGLEWSAGTTPSAEDTIALTIRYTEFADDLVDAHLEVPILPHELSLDLDSTSENGRNLTILDLSTPNGIRSMDFIEVLYSSWDPTGTTGPWNATKVSLSGIPRSVHVETVTYLPFEIDQGASNLNILDAFMRQMASRFFRIGAVLREVPRSVSELPSKKGTSTLDLNGGELSYLEFVSTSGTYLEGQVGTVAFQEMEGEDPSISARLQGIRYFKGDFRGNGNEVTLRMRGDTGLKVLAASSESMGWIELGRLPEEIHLMLGEDGIIFEGSDDGGPTGLPFLNYRFRDGSISFDADLEGLPPKLELKRRESELEITTGNGELGSVSVFVANGTAVPPVDLPGQNFVSIHREGDIGSVGLRINRLTRLVYGNSSSGFMEIASSSGTNLYALVEDGTANLSIDAVFVPLPSFVHVDFPSIINRTSIVVPDMTSVRTITEYSQVILSLRMLGEAPLSLAASLTEGLIKAIGTYSTGLSMSWDLGNEAATMELVIELEKEGGEEIDEAEWTHGIWMEQSGLGEDSSVKGKIYLQGMPTTGRLNLSFSELVIITDLDLKGYGPTYDWLLIRTSGVQDRDISLYMTGLSEGLDLSLYLMVYTDLRVGGSMVVDMDIDVKDRNGDPYDMGAMLATLRKAQPILSVRQMYLPEVPGRFVLDAALGEGVRANYSASKNIEYLYFKISKILDGRWSQIYSLFHDLPAKFKLLLEPNTDFTLRAPLPLQGLPSLDLYTSSMEMDMFIEYDGTGFGQRGRYQIYVEDIGPTRTFYEGDDYVIDSKGIGFISLQLDRLPFMESFTLSSLTLLGRDLKHVRVSADMVYGLYPMFTLSEGEGGSVQLKVSGDLEVAGRSYSPDLFFISLRTREVFGFEVISGLSIDKDTSALDMDQNSGELIVPAPLLTFWYWLLSPIFGGG